MADSSASYPKLGIYTTSPSNQPQPIFFWKPKGYLGLVGMSLIISLTSVILIMILARIIAMPGVSSINWPLLDVFNQLGVFLNTSLTLTWVPVSDRDTVIYLLILPIGALLISITRLTLGLRILGYRSILMAVGFNEIGVLPSLLVIILVIGVITILRPSMRHARLPLYGRISMALSITACILISALFLGSWLHSEWIWSLAFFPVIILAMMAESAAEALERESLGSAAWRLVWTVMIALVLLAILQSPSMLGILLQIPELILLELLGIVVISEFLDFRFFQDWRSSQIGVALSKIGYRSEEELKRRPRIAIIRNRSVSGTIGRLGPSAPALKPFSVQHLADALRDEGYVVKVLEGDRLLLRDLRNFLAPHPRTGIPGGVALNLSTGIQGYSRYLHVPAMLEMAGIAYTGPDPLGHARAQDQFTLFSLLKQAGIQVPPFRLLNSLESTLDDITLPALVFPRGDANAAIVAGTVGNLATVVKQIRSNYNQEIVIQNQISGPEFRVAIFGNTYLECLPILRIDPKNQKRECPALIEDKFSDSIREYAYSIYRIAGCRDYARIDLRLNEDGYLYVVGIHTQDIFARNGSLAIMLEAAGLSWRNLLRHIIELAAARTGAELATPLSANSIQQEIITPHIPLAAADKR